jgi:hypothetical protein
MSPSVDLGEWWIVLTNGEWFCGKRASSPRANTLLSLQKLVLPMSFQETPKGARPVLGVLTYPWFVDSLEVPEGSVWIAVNATSDYERWAPIIANTEALKLEKRASRTGLHLAR